MVYIRPFTRIDGNRYAAGTTQEDRGTITRELEGRPKGYCRTSRIDPGVLPTQFPVIVIGAE